MTATSTLISLACLIANSGSVDTSSIEAQISEEDQKQVVKIIDSGACLPVNLEQLLKKSKSKTGGGKIVESPTDGCFKE